MGEQTAGLQSIPIKTRNWRYSRLYRAIFKSLADPCCKVSDDRLPEVLARKGARYQRPEKDGKPPARKQKGAKVNAGEADTTATEPSAGEVKMREKLEILQARMDYQTRTWPASVHGCHTDWRRTHM